MSKRTVRRAVCEVNFIGHSSDARECVTLEGVGDVCHDCLWYHVQGGDGVFGTCEDCGDSLNAINGAKCYSCGNHEDCINSDEGHTYDDCEASSTCEECDEEAYWKLCAKHYDEHMENGGESTCGEGCGNGSDYRYCEACMEIHDENVRESVAATTATKSTVDGDGNISIDGMTIVFAD